MKNILCKMFGHKRDVGWWGDGLYGKVTVTTRDGIGRIHAHITQDCDRCGKSYILARFHVNTTPILQSLERWHK